MVRRKLDAYYTPTKLVDLLLDNYELDKTATYLEPCCGDGAIANRLRERGVEKVITNDLNTEVKADYYLDASAPLSWEMFKDKYRGTIDWVISNPPFKVAPQIIPHAYYLASNGIIMYLHLNYLEPCFNRYDWLKEHPPTSLIICPRVSFTGDGETYMMTGAWYIWDKWEDSKIKVVR